MGGGRAGMRRGMTDRLTPGVHEIAWVGTTVRSLAPVPGVGTWELVDHASCPGNGRLMALTPGEPAPLCPVCDREVSWQLSHLAPSVAADHRNAGKLP
jgi:hypothetical protein